MWGLHFACRLQLQNEVGRGSALSDGAQAPVPAIDKAWPCRASVVCAELAAAQAGEAELKGATEYSAIMMQ